MKTKRRMSKRGQFPDFRKFVFTATGQDTNLENFSLVDLADNLHTELDRIRSIATLLQFTSDELDTYVAGGVGLILRNIHDRMEAILKWATRKGKPDELQN